MRPRTFKPNILNIPRYVTDYIKHAFKKAYVLLNIKETKDGLDFSNANLDMFNNLVNSFKHDNDIKQDLSIDEFKPYGVRECFRVPDGKWLIDADYATAEVFAIAYLANDKKLISTLTQPDPQFAIKKMPDGTEKNVRIAYIDDIVEFSDKAKDPSLLHDPNDPTLLRDENGNLKHPKQDVHWMAVENKFLMDTPREKLDKNKTRDAAGKISNFCSGKDNYVLTYSNGYKKASEIKVGDILRGIRGKTTVKSVTRLNNQDCIELHLDSGIIATFHKMHRLRCWNGKSLVWKRVKNITPKDQIITFRTKNNISYTPKIIPMNDFMFKEHKIYPKIDINSKEFAYLMGLYLGDGNLSPHKLKTNANISYDLRQCISIETKDKFLELLKSLDISYTVNTISHSDKVCIVNYGGKGLGNFVYKNFIKNGQKTIPPFIFSQWSKETILSFISGLIDSDGSQLACGSGWILFNTNLKLLSDVAVLANNIGLRTYLKICKSKLFKNGISFVEGKNGPYKPCGKLNIYADKDINLSLLNSYKNASKLPTQWNYSWNLEDNYRKSIYKEVKSKISSKDKTSWNAYSNIRDGYTSFTEFNLKALEKYKSLKLPLKSTWFPSKVISKRELKDDIIAIECTTHEYIDMSLNSHNSIPYGTSAELLERQVELASGEKPEKGTGQRMIDSYMLTKPDVAKFLEKCKQTVFDPGYYQAPSGYKRHYIIPDENSGLTEKQRSKIIGSVQRQACNIPLQNLVADSLARSIISMHRYCRKNNLKTRIFMPLYDCNYCEVVPEEIDIIKKLIVKCMSTDNYWDLPGGRLSFTAEPEIGKACGTKLTKREEEELNNILCKTGI